MSSNTPNSQAALAAFEVLFCRIDDDGRLQSSGNAPLPDLGRFLQAAETAALPGTAGGADYLNSLCRTAGSGDFADLLAREVFDALITLNIFPDDLNSGDPESDSSFLLEQILILFRYLADYDTAQIPGGSAKLLPRAKKLFSTLPQNAPELVALLKKSDPFSSGKVFSYRQRRFVAVEPATVRKPNKFYGYPGVRSAYEDHFRSFAQGKTNLPLLINSLPGYGKTSMVISYALAQENIIPILAEPDALEENWTPLIQALAKRKDHRFVIFFDDIDPAKVDWYSFRTNVGGAFAPPENVMPVLTANYEFPASILSRGRKITYPVFDELRCSEMVEDFLRGFGMQRPPVNLISLIGAEYTNEFGQKKFTELSPRTLIRYLSIYERDQNKRRTMIELASGEMITRPDPELFYEFNINLMRSLYGEEYIQRLLKEKLREL